MGQPEWSEPAAAYATHVGRGNDQTQLDELISAWTATSTPTSCSRLLHEGGVPAGRIYKAADMLADPHFEARDAIVQVPDQTFGTLTMQNVVPKLSATPGSIRWTGADLGPVQRRGVRRAARPRRGAARRARRNGRHLMDRDADYEAAGFRGRIGFGERPAVVVVDVVRAYLETARSTDADGRFESARASAARVVDAARAAGHPVRLHRGQDRARRRRRRLVRGQGARPRRSSRRARRTPPSRTRRRPRRARSW